MYATPATPLPITVYFVVPQDSLALDWAGPAEALRITNQLLQERGQAVAFDLHFVSPTQQVRSLVGMHLCGLAPLPDLRPQLGAACAWVVLIGQPGHAPQMANPATPALLHWLGGLQLHSGRLELLCICAGSLLAAQAGLLAGRSATTHHKYLDQLRLLEPRCEVQANRVFVPDPPLYSSAGVTTGIDLMLHRIAQTCGEALAAQVAQNMVVALRRGPHDPELSPFLAYRKHLHAALHRVQDAINEHPQAHWSVPDMAAVACTSPRHLTRLFIEHAGIAPQQYLRRIRLAVAQTALNAGHNVTQAAALAGLTDAQLRRCWIRFGLPGTPSGAALPAPDP